MNRLNVSQYLANPRQIIGLMQAKLYVVYMLTITNYFLVVMSDQNFDYPY